MPPTKKAIRAQAGASKAVIPAAAYKASTPKKRTHNINGMFDRAEAAKQRKEHYNFNIDSPQRAGIRKSPHTKDSRFFKQLRRKESPPSIFADPNFFSQFREKQEAALTLPSFNFAGEHDQQSRNMSLLTVLQKRRWNI